VKGLITFVNRFFSLILGFSILTCCGMPEKKKPEYILSQEQMVETLGEVYIAEQKVNRLSLNADSAFLVFGSMEKKIFENLSVPDSVFRASVEYYMDHPKEMEAIYAVLIDSLQLREQRVPREAVQ
jgi:hypothetical protein